MNYTCTKCLVEKPETEFASRGGGKKHQQCKQCKRLAIKQHYEANKDQYVQRAKKHNRILKKRMRAICDEAKSKPCVDCGQTYPPYVMDFDHLPGCEKITDVATLALQFNKAKLLLEIEKCEAVCSNCHRERTHQRRLAKKAIL